MGRIAIIDDDKVFQDLIYALVNNIFNDNYQVNIFNNGIDFLEVQEKYDLVILDINLPILDGITLSKKIAQRCKLILFVTSLKDKVFDAFGINIFGFILKSEIDKKLPIILNVIKIELENKNLLNFKTLEAILKIKADDIYSIVRQNRKIYLNAIDKEYYLPNTTLKSIFSQLDESFIFIDKSCIINSNHIYKIQKNIMILNNSKEYIISRDRLKKIKERFLIEKFNDKKYDYKNKVYQ